ncbi:MAG: fimbria/pilus periplasmic chaperone [Steroidobacteraceae bacterium]|jgi:fimbrial chaperone protein
MQLKIWLAALAVANFAHASSFNISPIRAELSGAHHTDVMTLTNADDGPVVVEVRVVKWSQDNGADQLDDTRELLVTPPVLQIPGKGEQIIRVALRREPDPTRETTYRLIFQEVPQAATPDFTGLRVALRLSVPIFVAPSRGKAQADVAWDAHWLPDGTLEVAATNSGNGHLQVIDFELQLPGGAVVRGLTAKYLLAGSHMVWTVAPPADAQKDGAITIHGHSDQGEFSADVANNGS